MKMNKNDYFNEIKLKWIDVDNTKEFWCTAILANLMSLVLNDNLAVDDNNYYTITISGPQQDIILELKNSLDNGTIIPIDLIYEENCEYTLFQSGVITFSCVKTGVPTGLDGCNFIINQWLDNI